jgi:proteasome lid subunit RPN8/RPN11
MQVLARMLIMDPKILDDIFEHALETYPEECCGILTGSDRGGDRVVSHAHRARNVSAERRHERYRLDERKLFEVIRSMRGQSSDVVGFYHSHPAQPSSPSEHDTEQAGWPGYTYLIVSVENGRVASAQAWVMPEENTSFIEQPLHVGERVP